MAVLNATVPTLLDLAKSVNKDGSSAMIVEMLSQQNGLFADMSFKEGNLPTGERTVIRTGLPTVYWRLINQGIPPSKSTTAQVDEGVGMLEAWSEVDVALADLNGNSGAWRLGEAKAFLEALRNEFEQTVIYGNSGASPEEFTGLAVRYSDSSAANGKNIIKAGGSGSDNTSIFLIGWSPTTVTGIVPKGSPSGIVHRNLGEETVEATASVGGQRMRAYRDQFVMKGGLVVKDWRYCVRICNIDVSNLVANSGSQADIPSLMAKAYHRLPDLRSVKAVFYMNRTAFEMLDVQRRDDVITGGGLSYDTVDGQAVPTFRGLPIRITDQILETEATVS